jgi:hypothetical protein
VHHAAKALLGAQVRGGEVPSALNHCAKSIAKSVRWSLASVGTSIKWLVVLAFFVAVTWLMEMQAGRSLEG